MEPRGRENLSSGRRGLRRTVGGVTVGKRRATDGGVEAVVKLSAARRILEVRGDTGGEGGSRATSELASEMEIWSPSVSRGVECGLTEIRALRRTGLGLVMDFRALGVRERAFGDLLLGAIVVG